MTVEFKSNIDLKKTADQLLTKLERALETQMRLAKEELVERTLGGKDANNNRLAPYSKSYIKQLRNAGKATNVDLSATNNMLRSLQTSATTRNGVLEGKIFTNEDERKKIRYAHEGASNRPRRRFFALSKEQLNKITKALSKLGKL